MGFFLTVATYSSPAYFSEMKLTGDEPEMLVFRFLGLLGRILDLWYHSLLKEPASLVLKALINWAISILYSLVIYFKKRPILFSKYKRKFTPYIQYIKVFLSMKSSFSPVSAWVIATLSILSISQPCSVPFLNSVWKDKKHLWHVQLHNQ